MTAVRLAGIEKSFGDQRVLKDVSIDIVDREFMVFVGPSGCGKSTLLRTIAGLERASAGRIVIGDEDVTRLPPARRGVAMVFQSYALYPHMSVRDNIAFGLRIAGLASDEVQRRTREAAAILQIEDLLERKPKALSGGQRQRVAIGRAIVRDPRVFLFDEPLSNLDAALRVQMRLELIRLHDRLDATMIYVTHDQTEAMTMADRIVVLKHGRVEQIGTPLAVYHSPDNLFVAGFIGSPKMNLLPATLIGADGGGAAVRLDAGAEISLAATAADLDPSAAVTFGVRPEHIVPAAEAADDDAHLTGDVLVVEQLGGETLVHLRLQDGSDLTMKTPGQSMVAAGDRLQVALRTSHCHLFDSSGVALPRLGDQPGPSGPPRRAVPAAPPR